MRLEHLLSGENDYNKDTRRGLNQNPMLLDYVLFIDIEKDEAER